MGDWIRPWIALVVGLVTAIPSLAAVLPVLSVTGTLEGVPGAVVPGKLDMQLPAGSLADGLVSANLFVFYDSTVVALGSLSAGNLVPADSYDFSADVAADPALNPQAVIIFSFGPTGSILFGPATGATSGTLTAFALDVPVGAAPGMYQIKFRADVNGLPPEAVPAGSDLQPDPGAFRIEALAQVNVVAVPEPGTWGSVLIGLLALVALRAYRAKASSRA